MRTRSKFELGPKIKMPNPITDLCEHLSTHYSVSDRELVHGLLCLAVSIANASGDDTYLAEEIEAMRDAIKARHAEEMSEPSWRH